MFGACIGSFLNVCIYRLPSSKSIIDPLRSVCPKCNTVIKNYDNIPLLSYLWLKGRCRRCDFHIPFRYFLIELISGFFAICVFFKFGLTLEALIYYAFIASLLVVTFIDIDYQIIPDVITLPGILIYFFASFALPSTTWINSIIGILVGGGSLLSVAWGYNLLTGKEGMGGGDIKLLAMIGAIEGWKGVLFTIFSASAVGTFAGIIVMIQARKGLKLAVPFGPFLSIGAILYIFFGANIIQWYFGLF